MIGRGLPNKAGVYTLPYLQSGHILLLAVLLLCATVTYPGFPLTQVTLALTLTLTLTLTLSRASR